MEVHHHPNVEKKNFKEYFLEFLMIFLAVTLGFFAENIREHLTDKDKEKIYIQNLYEDLKSDTIAFSKYQKSNLEFFNKIDSLVILIKSSDRNNHINEIYFLARTATMRNGVVYPNERTFDEMKSAGLLRLISNRQIADSVSYYYNALKGVTGQNQFILQKISDYMQSVSKIFDGEILLKILKNSTEEQPSDSLKLLTDDPLVINELLVNAQYLYGAISLQNGWVIDQENGAKRLIESIKKEYNLENE